eukprot:gb/GECG01010158.1/.p1 GENE.gb/GECG01010158.1/~~gb/GECG01010158.1/.p1  ORF type:complete len:266 (+),score=13.41 gb/GECG01010158.1/:1-798(+)
MNFELLGHLALLDFAIQWFGFLVAVILKTEKFFDLLGTSSFTVCTFYALYVGQQSHAISLQHIMGAMAVCLWTVRLGSFLVYRIAEAGKDKRFDKIKRDPVRFFFVWTFQGVWVLCTPLPVYCILGTAIPPSKGIDFQDAIAMVLWVIGFIGEAVADHQKLRFRMQPENKDKFIDRGLWSCSRHPNYFFEMQMWISLALFCQQYLEGIWHLALVGPLVEIGLLCFVSGIPLLEESAERKWGNDPRYRRYKENTNLLIPVPRGLSN